MSATRGSTKKGGVSSTSQEQRLENDLEQLQAQTRQLLLQGEEDMVTVVNENGVPKKQRPEWQLKKTDSKTRKLRQNARVKKAVKPKCAITVLHEMYPEVAYKTELITSYNSGIYRAYVNIGDKNYSGEGYSKSMAKQNVSERALKSIFLEKLSKIQEAEKTEMEGDEPPARTPATDDFPWGKLASFAVRKLFDSWGEENAFPRYPHAGPYGNPHSFIHPHHVSFSNYPANGFSNYPSCPAYPFMASHLPPAKKFPEEPLKHNPINLLNQTWPNLHLSITSVHKGLNVEYCAAAALEGFLFSATSSNKKDVKQQIARAIISTLRGVNYPEGFNAEVRSA